MFFTSGNLMLYHVFQRAPMQYPWKRTGWWIERSNKAHTLEVMTMSSACLNKSHLKYNVTYFKRT